MQFTYLNALVNMHLLCSCASTVQFTYLNAIVNMHVLCSCASTVQFTYLNTSVNSRFWYLVTLILLHLLYLSLYTMNLSMEIHKLTRIYYIKDLPGNKLM